MRLEAYVSDINLAKDISRRATKIYGGATMVQGWGETVEWGQETSYIVTTFVEATLKCSCAYRRNWEQVVSAALLDFEEVAAWIVMDNNGFEIRKPITHE